MAKTQVKADFNIISRELSVSEMENILGFKGDFYTVLYQNS